MVAASVAPDRLRLVVSSPSVYLVPRQGGRVLVGATVEHVGFDTRVTLDAVRQLLDAALALCPRLAGAALERAWAGLRPYSPDGLPLLGEWPGLPGLVLATGHFRNGILLAPITGRLIAELIVTGRPPALLAPCAPARFGG
jgi:glycine oxidase